MGFTNLYVIIPVFNRKAVTLRCLELLRNQTFTNFIMVVVDDGSTDGTTDGVRAKFPEVIIITGTGNWWWAKSINQGCKYALLKGADAVLLLNDDTYFDNDYLYRLYTIAQQHPGAIIGSLSITKDHPHKIFFSGIKRIIWWKAKSIRYHKKFETYHEQLTGVHTSVVLPGRGLYIPAFVFEQIGFISDSKFPQYFGDFDLVLRANKNGIPTLISWDLIIYTYLEQTGKGAIFIKQDFFTFLKAFFNRYSHRSLITNFYYLWKHCKWYYFPLSYIIDKIRIFYSFLLSKKQYFS